MKLSQGGAEKIGKKVGVFTATVRPEQFFKARE
jgi:hypothetical protein